MRILTETYDYGRYTINLTKDGIVARHERHRVGGGFIIKDHVTFLWPWVRRKRFKNYQLELEKLDEDNYEESWWK